MSVPTPTRAAVLDLGSNSFHVLVADVEGPHVDTVARAREMLHLGRTLVRRGELDAATVELAAATVDRHLRLARRAGAEEVVVVATAALREPEAAELLERLTELIGRPPTVLHGHEEARLAHLGARAAVLADDRPLLVLDLGGGSLELAVGSGTRIDASTSVLLGASRLAATVEGDPPDPEELDGLIARLDGELAGALPALQHHATERVVAVGGTVRAMARHLAARADRWLPASVNLAPLDLDELEAATAELLAATTAERTRLEGVSSRRADHLHIAGLVLVRTLHALGVRHAVVSDWGLREGVLLDRFGDLRAIPGDARRSHEVGRLVRASRLDERDGLRLARLARRIDRALSEGEDEGEQSLLDAAAQLHDIGSILPLRRQHEHGAYVIEQAELRGFSPRELAIVLSIVRFLPSRGVSGRYPPFASLDLDDRALARRLLGVLRLAVMLSADGEAEVVALRRSGELLEITVRDTAGGVERLARDATDLEGRLRADLGIAVAIRSAPGG